VIANLSIVGDDDDGPGSCRPERQQRLRDPIADDLVRGGVTGEADGETGREAAARATAGVPIEDQLDLGRRRERGTQASDQRNRRQRRNTAGPDGSSARKGVLHVAAIDEDPIALA